MSIIKQLDESTINKIAAGEVIERPAGVVKELIENATDAKASAITVEIKDGGISMIRITDNGCGIEADDLDNAFLRHSTSKITSVEDLIAVRSLGFRGEALSSIAAVSQVELITKTHESLLGNRYIIEGGVKKSLDSIGAPSGTTFIIRNLFYNTPVRRKFLKTPQTEATYIKDIVEKMAIAHPDISFKLIINGQLKLSTSAKGNLKDIIYSIYGRDITNNLIEIDNYTATSEDTDNNMHLHGFIGKSMVSRGNRGMENFFINGRYIKSGLISRAVEEAYSPYMMGGRYPFCALNLIIPPELIDVNIHPTKMEIKFSNDEQVYRFINKSIREALTFKPAIVPITLDTKSNTKVESKIETRIESKTEAMNETKSASKFENKAKVEPIVETKAETMVETKVEVEPKVETKPENEANTKFYSESKPAAYSNPISKVEIKLDTVSNVGVKTEEKNISNSEIKLVSRPGNVAKPAQKPAEPFESNRISQQMVVKETAKYQPAHTTNAPLQMELFDKNNDDYKKKNYHIIGQLFLTYWLIEYEDKLYIIDQHAAHEKVLYEKIVKQLKASSVSSQMLTPPIIVTLSGEYEIVLQENIELFEKLGFQIEHFGGMEYNLYAIPANLPKISQQDFFLDILESLSARKVTVSSDVLLEKLASMSCKAAVKAGHKLTSRECISLIDELMLLDNPFNCPHGRPVIISMTKQELEKKFKRII